MKKKSQQKILAYRDVVWNEEIDQAIGTASDSIIGRRFGISPRTITVRRRSMGKIVNRKKSDEIVWTKTMEKQLGRMPDTALAKKLNLTPYWISKRRSEMGIAAYVMPEAPKSNKKRSKLKLTPGRIASLGKSSDAFLAKRWGAAAGTVTRARRNLGIEPYRINQDIVWTKQMLNMLGEVPDNRIADIYEFCSLSVKIKRIEMRIPPFGKSEMDPEPELPIEVINLIGKVPDKHISDEYKISRSKLRIYRALHGIPLAEYKPPTEHTWKKHELALLGTMSDGAIARKIKIPAVQVCHQRRRLAIAPFNRKGKMSWTKDNIAQLGKSSDQELARRWKIPQRNITAKRESLSIAACTQIARKWTKSELKQLGTVLDTELAEQLDVSSTLVARKRKELNIPAFRTSAPFEWKPAMLKRLGEIPDDELALELGVSYQFVAAKRLSLNIPTKRRSSLKWTEKIVEKMGKVSDAQIAKEIGFTSALVKLKRNELGIAPFQ